MGEKTLKRYVTVDNPETGKTITFRPGQKLPGWAEKQITNPKAFRDPKIQRPNRLKGDASGIFSHDAVQATDMRQKSEAEDE